ncbi:efflux RND transporter permease subunit [Halotalea alkalilenta]|uniref:efflux RND transporter permease subunit n=1 Tax=Halotalea alkalilenta TaxID=376489 RepID=UPI000694A6F9|nr:multidrug efflux RND transporter permease subunit [Halotalea alkalilenta]
MNISNFFINRPVFASVISIIITLVGLMAMRVLPIAQYPEVVPPEVSVQATFPGANAETVAETVAAPIAQEINGVENVLYMTSTSSDNGVMQMRISFAIGSDGDVNTINVNNRVQRALSQLPESVQSQGVDVELRSSDILMLVSLTSDQYSNIYMQNYATLNIIDELRQIEGVGEAEVLGGGEFAMRIWMDPDKLAQYDLTPSEVSAAIQAQNTEIPAGSLAAAPQSNPRAYTYTISAGGRLNSAEEFRNILLRTNADGSSLRLRDVARIELGASFYGIDARLNGAAMAPIIINQQPGANAVQTAERVKALMADLSQRFPPGLHYEVPYDTTLFINASIESVTHTFIEALVLVAVIVFVFLQNWRTTVIAMSVVPVSVVGTFAGMYLLGFSINLLSLFGMILAIGIVVDDAILVVENIERIIEEDDEISIHDATIEAMREVGGPIIATSFIMASVFVPVGFLGGLTGQIYQQFAITIAISVAISALVALTFTPSMSSILLQRKSEQRDNVVTRVLKAPFKIFDRVFEKITQVYLWMVRLFVRFWIATIAIMVALTAFSFWLYEQSPTTLIPETDQGVFITAINLPNGSSVDRTNEYMSALSDKVEQLPGVSSVSAIAGYDMLSQAVNTARGVMFISLNPWEERDVTVEQLLGQVMQAGASTPGGTAMAFNMPPILGLSTTGGFEGFLTSLQGASSEELSQASLKVMQAANQRPELAQVFTTFDVSVPSYRASIDQEKATGYGVSLTDLNDTLSSTLGNAFVNYFTYQGRNFQVYLQNEDDFRSTPEDLNRIYVRSSTTGDRIPISEFVTLERQNAPSVVTRFNVYSAAKFQGSPAPGYSSGQAVEAMEQVVQETLGTGWTMEWTGTTYQEVNTGDAAVLAVIFGLLMVFLILAAQYESWTTPLAVITAVPFAFFGAVVAVYLRGLDVSVYVEVGLLVVVGLAAKNAILIVEFAELQRKDRGLSISQAAIESAHLRFRPIVMTSLAFIFGVLPLALASGASDTSSHHIGTTVVGGMLSVAILASIFVPSCYAMIAHAQVWVAKKRGKDTDHQVKSDGNGGTPAGGQTPSH